jgi:hypothetical protein
MMRHDQDSSSTAAVCPKKSLVRELCEPSRLVAAAAEERLSFSPSSWQLFRHTLAGGISLTPLTLLAVPPFELFSDLLNRRAHGHGWVTE